MDDQDSATANAAGIDQGVCSRSNHDLLLNGVLESLTALHADMLQFEELHADPISQVHPSRRESARNLIHYLSLRQHDLRELQELLTLAGLSSLGRAEASVLPTLEAVMKIAARALDYPLSVKQPSANEFGFGSTELARQAHSLLGPPPSNRHVRIMVTIPGEAARKPQLIQDLLDAGMNCMRINCAHDNASVWEQIISSLRECEAGRSSRCPVLMDLPGPKCRTGLLPEGPGVVKLKPRRDFWGAVLEPATAVLTDNASAAFGDTPLIPVTPAFVRALRPRDRIQLRDARDRLRVFTVTRRAEGLAWVRCNRTAYVVAGSTLRVMSKDRKGLHGQVGALPPVEMPLRLAPGDHLVLTRDQVPGEWPKTDSQGNVIQPARVACTLPEVFGQVVPGEAVWLDDGKFGAVVHAVAPGEIDLRITHARPQGQDLRSDKGINFPDSRLDISGLTHFDVSLLPFVAAHADLVGLSFVREASDVFDLQNRMTALGRRDMPLVLKIETRRAFENLPSLLLASMRGPCSGVMIARGDLAIECGYERLAEIQEEVLWLAEAAHMPAVWATQVLENATKTGQPSRAEVTDAAMAERAESVMLNKGPYIARTVRILDDILRRMEEHQSKKRSMLRRLNVATRFDTE